MFMADIQSGTKKRTGGNYSLYRETRDEPPRAPDSQTRYIQSGTKKRTGGNYDPFQKMRDELYHALDSQTGHMFKFGEKINSKVRDTYVESVVEIAKAKTLGYGEKLQDVIVSAVPSQYRDRFEKILKTVDYSANQAFKYLKKYMKKVVELDDIYERERKISIEPTNNHIEKRAEIKKITDERKSAEMELKMYQEVFKNSMSDLYVQRDIALDQLRKYAKEKESGESRTGNLILIALTSVFGISVIWALSQIGPGSVTIGAFVEGGASPVILSMLTATVIFLLIFLSHHKLE